MGKTCVCAAHSIADCGCGGWDRVVIYTDTIKKKLQETKERKIRHKASEQCEEKTMSRCTACHFWSGAIAALSELIGEPGVID